MATRIRGCRSSASTIGRYACRNAASKTCGKFPTGWWLWIASERMRWLDMLLDPGDEPAGIEHAAGVELTLQFLHQRQRLWGRSPHVHCLLYCGRRGHEDRVPVILLRQRDQTREPYGHQAGVVERKPHRTRARVSDVPERTPPGHTHGHGEHSCHRSQRDADTKDGGRRSVRAEVAHRLPHPTMRITVKHLCRQSELPRHRLDVPDVAGHRLLEPFSPDRDTGLGGLKSGRRGNVAADDGYRGGRGRGGR